jgi:hypothetical protein
MPIHIVKSGTYSASIDGCYRVVVLKAVVPLPNDTTMADKPGKGGKL